MEFEVNLLWGSMWKVGTDPLELRGVYTPQMPDELQETTNEEGLRKWQPSVRFLTSATQVLGSVEQLAM